MRILALCIFGTPGFLVGAVLSAFAIGFDHGVRSVDRKYRR